MIYNTSFDYGEPYPVRAVGLDWSKSTDWIAVPFAEVVIDRGDPGAPEVGTTIREGVEYYSRESWEAESDPEFVREGDTLRDAGGAYAPSALEFMNVKEEMTEPE